jgi:hypothetical protein
VIEMERALRAERAPRGAPPRLGLVAPLPAAQRARRLFDEAREASLEHVEALGSAIGVVRELAGAVAEGDELYGPGLREFAERLAEDLLWKSKTLEAMAQRRRAAIHEG